MDNQRSDVIESGSFRIYLTDPIGKGAYGTVYFAENLNDMETYAAKIIDRVTSSVTDEIQNLIKVSSKSQHIVRFVDFFYLEQKAIIITEYCDSSLGKIMSQNGGRLTENLAQLYFIELLMGMKDLHDSDLMHRDIKMDNIFFKDGVLKLGDLGFTTDKRVSEKVIGTPVYMPPEMLSQAVNSQKRRSSSSREDTSLYPSFSQAQTEPGETPTKRTFAGELIEQSNSESGNSGGLIYDKNIDVWSCGILLYQMLFGDLPFQLKSTGNFLADLKQLVGKQKEITPDRLFQGQSIRISDSLKDLLVNMLKPEANERFRFSTIWTSEWVNEGLIRYHGRINFDRYIKLSNQSQIQLSSIGFASRINRTRVKNRLLVETYNKIKKRYNNENDHVKVLNLLENILFAILQKYKIERRIPNNVIREFRQIFVRLCFLYLLLKRKQIFELNKLRDVTTDPALTAIMIGSDPALCEKVLRDLSAEEFDDALRTLDLQISQLTNAYAENFKEMRPDFLVSMKLSEAKKMSPESSFSEFEEHFFAKIKDACLADCFKMVKEEQFSASIQLLAKKFYCFCQVYEIRKTTDDFMNLSAALENMSDIDLNETFNSELEKQSTLPVNRKTVLWVLVLIIVLLVALVIQMKIRK